MNGVVRPLLLALALLTSGCATLSHGERVQAALVADRARPTALDCNREDACARPSPLRALAGQAFAASTPEAPRHYALILDRGEDALLARLDLIRGARHSIDLQTYIFSEDDAGRLVLEELLAAARRGVQVRVLIDQLSALEDVRTLAALAAAHANFRLQVYNPVLGHARLSYAEYLLASVCCWRRLNQRMHSKLLVVDRAVAITGGRNYQNDYYDWNPDYNFRDRDVLVAGPAVRAMADNFEAFWVTRRSVPAEQLADVGRWLLRRGAAELPRRGYAVPERVEAVSRAADDPARMQALAAAALPVGAVEFLADLPDKHGREAPAYANGTGHGLRGLIESAREEVLLQTPYLVLSKPAQRMFEAMHQRPDAPRVKISTNSLAATDAFIVYALSHKYKRRYLRDFGFHIYEYKPFPADAPVNLALARAGVPPPPVRPVRVDRGSAVRRPPRRTPLERENTAARYFGSGANERVPLQRGGTRIGLHAKSLVVDERVGVIGTHNFDPRGDGYNTESAVVIPDAAFARALAASIRRDMAPANAWVIAPRDKPPVFSGLDYSLGKLSEHLPVFDLWPTRYATSYEFVPGPDCPFPVPRDHPDFRRCHRPVGDFPEVSLGLKGLTTRIFTAFGAGLAPIL